MTDQLKVNFFELLEQVRDFGQIKSADFVAYTLPLIAQVKQLHENKKCIYLHTPSDLVFEEGHLKFDGESHEVKMAQVPLFKKPQAHKAIEFAIAVRESTDLDSAAVNYQSILILQADEELVEAKYISGYQSWELKLGHCDPLTDIYQLGLYFASLAYGLDFNVKAEFEQFVESRKRLFFLNKNLHPTIHAVIFEMTELYREDRLRTLEEAGVKLKNYRDYNPENFIDLTQTEGFRNQDLSKRSNWILARLKSRLFDMSRRNKLLYFTDKKSFINLTISSVPLLLDHNNIREEDLIFWNDKIKDKLLSKKKLELNAYLDFQGNRYLSPTLNQIRLESRKNQNEYGFNTLKVIVAFLHWYNFKENENEMITSPLLLLPGEVVKKKGVNDQYELLISDTDATVNPVLSFYLKDLYGITLPDFVDLSSTSMEDLIQSIQQQIAAGGTGIQLEWRKKPRIQLIHTIAKKNFNIRNKNLNNRTRGLQWKDFNYSYATDEFQPLGVQIFKDRIQPKNNALEYIINEDLTFGDDKAVADKERTFYTTKEDGDLNPTIWQIDTCNITVGNFNYRKMSLVSDYNQIIDESLQDEIFERLFSETPKKLVDQQKHKSNLADNYPIISCDPTQSSAIDLARTGESYIIQGPPGTGKSQTITNLIADYIARDKKVLFVCEKRAALDVVFHRLKNKQLDELCCLVHDSQADKKSFIMDLKDTYEDFIRHPLDSKAIGRKRKLIITTIQEQVDRLTYFHQTMQTGEISALELYEVLHATKDNKNFPSASALIHLPFYQEWNANLDWINDFYTTLNLNKYKPCIAHYPFVNLSRGAFSTTNLKSEIQEQLEKATRLLDEFSEGLDNLDETIPPNLKLADWREYSNLADKISGVFEKGKLDVFDKTSVSAQALDTIETAIANTDRKLEEIALRTKNWKTKLSEQDVASAKKQWTNFQKSFFKFLNPSFYKFKGLIKANYNFSAHTVAPEIGEILDDLQKEYALIAEKTAEKKKAIDLFMLQDFEKELAWIRKEQVNPQPLLKVFRSGSHDDLIHFLIGFNDSFNALIEHLRLIFGSELNFTIEELEQRLSEANHALGSLSAFLPFVERLDQVSPELKKCLTQESWIARDFEFNLAYKSLMSIYEHEPTFAEMDEDGIRLNIRRINQLMVQYYASNVESIRAAIRHKFLEIIKTTEATAAQLSMDQKSRKKGYLNGRRILENEFGKSMRYKSIRDLASSDANAIMTALKPVWLMSPLSVSDTMPIDINLFDVVIFDEASQITVEEGVPALFRTKQTIIVGDEMQMPPSNFFNAVNVQEDEDDEIEGKIGVSLDADSLLNQGARKLSSVMLGWHYRSRRESLISFSNAAFYKRSLLTIPDKVIHSESISTIAPILDSTLPVNVDAILSRSISYHQLENGLYNNRRNTDEAVYIANMVAVLLKSGSRKSIGIVAFSMDQQSEIEEALERLTLTDPIFDRLLEEEYQRIDEDQFNGLFVKNLENVQGDERDIIIMSVCYGYNQNGKMLMNFGPINRRGGEKRLNVIFSRAKMHMVVVTSITPQEIKNDYNEGANYFKKFLTYAQYISDGRLEDAAIVLDGLHNSDALTSLQSGGAVAAQLKLRLESMGYQLDESIGQSYFKCNLAIKSEDQSTYQLGILIDQASHYANPDVVEQYCQRPEILAAFGWNVITVYAKDWLERPERVIERICQALAGEIILADEELEFDLPEDLPIENQSTNMEFQEKPVADVQAPKDKKGVESSSLSGFSFERVEFIEGTSNKFWQIAVDDTTIVIQYGRIGNQAQENVKTFETYEKAIIEKDKLLNKKLAKGYVRV